MESGFLFQLMNNIPTEHFDKDHYMNPHNAPQPTPSLDEISDKAWKDCHYQPANMGVRIIKQAILEYNASFIEEVERLKLEVANKSFYPVHGCFTGDCPHDNANQCLEAIKEYVAEMERDNDQLHTQLSTADRLRDEACTLVCQRENEIIALKTEHNIAYDAAIQKAKDADRTGYERGIREAAKLVIPDGNPEVAKTAILNLLNKRTDVKELRVRIINKDSQYFGSCFNATEYPNDSTSWRVWTGVTYMCFKKTECEQL